MLNPRRYNNVACCSVYSGLRVKLKTQEDTFHRDNPGSAAHIVEYCCKSTRGSNRLQSYWTVSKRKPCG